MNVISSRGARQKVLKRNFLYEIPLHVHIKIYDLFFK
jgi:hypothetical protein